MIADDLISYRSRLALLHAQAVGGDPSDLRRLQPAQVAAVERCDHILRPIEDRQVVTDEGL